MQKSRYIQVLAVLLLVCFLVFAYNSLAVNTSSDRTINDSAIDLRSISKIYDLNGEWYFFANEFISIGQLSENVLASSDRLTVPGNWNDLAAYSENRPGEGYGTYVVKLIADRGSHIGIRMPNISTEYKVFVDDELLLEHGELSKESGGNPPVNTTHLVYFMPKREVSYLIIQVSNYTYNKGGITRSIIIGELNKAIQYRSNALLQDIFVSAGVLLYVVYHLILYILGRRDKVVLWLILFSLSIIVLIIHLPINETLRTYLFPGQFALSPNRTAKLIASFLVLSFSKPVFLLYPKETPKWAGKMLLVVTVLLGVHVLILPDYELSYTLPIIIGALGFSSILVLTCLIKAIHHKRDGAVVELVGTVFLIATALFDFLTNRQFIQDIGISFIPIGLLAFLVITAYVVTTKYTNAFSELKISNEALKRKQMQVIQQGQLASVGHLASGMAHEINNPLGYVKSNSAMLKECFDDLVEKYMSQHQFESESDKDEIKELNSEVDEIYSDIDDGILRIQGIINDLRSYSRVDETTDFMLMNVNEIIRLSSRLFEFNLNKNIKLEFDLKEIPPIHVYDKEIGQVILNFMLNASESVTKKYGSLEGGLIEIHTYFDNGFIYIDIYDNGIGIESDKLGTVFQPFYTTKNIGEGLGLGLSVSNEIIQKHGGSIEVTSKLDAETIFTIILPVLDELV